MRRADADVARYVERREAVLDRVRAMLVDSLGLERPAHEIDPDTPLFGSGLGLDSIDAVELVVQLDTLFGVRLADHAFARAELRTVNGLVDLVLAAEGSDDAAER
jgi:acyl carrier protein